MCEIYPQLPVVLPTLLAGLSGHICTTVGLTSQPGHSQTRSAQKCTGGDVLQLHCADVPFVLLCLPSLSVRHTAQQRCSKDKYADGAVKMQQSKDGHGLP